MALQHGTKVDIRAEINCVNSCRSCDLIYNKGILPSVGKTGQEPCESVRTGILLIFIDGGFWVPMQVSIGQGNVQCSLLSLIYLRYAVNIEGRCYAMEFQWKNHSGSVLIMCNDAMRVLSWIGCQKFRAIVNLHVSHATLHGAEQLMVKIRNKDCLVDNKMVVAPIAGITITNCSGNGLVSFSSK